MNASSQAVRVQALFEQALASGQDDRTRLLAQLRASDPPLADELASLLLYADETGMLDADAASLARELVIDAPLADAAPPARVGPYEIIRELGRGGMGVVYEALQASPRRSVALKVVRSDIATPPLLRRFRHEAQALALLQHPGIAQVLEAGVATVDGSPRSYIAMELAPGLALHAWARAHTPAPRTCLALIARIADAVDHAHKRGVIHRDLKPSNIIVSDAGEPKILDFGVARLVTDGPQASATIATSAGQVVGTLGYMSPQQLSGDPRAIDVRVDVYALGAMLYELLARRPAIELASLSLLEALDAVKTREPAPLGRLNPALRGDIEAIVSKALEKDADRRYQSAADLADDIRRHLAGHAVQARPLTIGYQLSRFAVRNKAMVAAAGALALAVTLGVIGTGWQAIRATRAATQASQQAQRAQQTSEVLRRMIAGATPQVAAGRELTVREMLVSSAQELQQTTDIDPVVRASTHALLGDMFYAISRKAESREQWQAAFDLYTRMLGPRHPDTLRAEVELGLVASSFARSDEHVSRMRDLVDRCRAVLGADHATSILAESAVSIAVGDVSILRQPESIAIAQAAWERARKALGPDAPVTMRTLQSLIVASGALSRDPRMVDWSHEYAERMISRFGPQSASALEAQVQHASVLYNAGRRDESFALRQALDADMHRVLGPDSFSTIANDAGLSTEYYDRGMYPQAVEKSRAVIASLKRTLDPDPTSMLIHRNRLAGSLIRVGECEQGAAITRELLIEWEGRGATPHVLDKLRRMHFLASLCMGDEAQARASFAAIETASEREDALADISTWFGGRVRFDERETP